MGRVVFLNLNTVGELSSEFGASRLGASFLRGELSLGKVSWVSCPVSFGTKLN